MKSFNSLFLASLTVAGLTFFGGAAEAATLVYEGFDYPNLGNSRGSDPITGLGGGTGWGTTWTTESDGSGGLDVWEIVDGLTFTGVETTGNATRRIGTGNRGIANRTLSPTSQAALTADNTTIWFSFLADGNSGSDFAFIFGDTPHTFGSGDPVLAAPGDAFGFAWIGNTMYGIEHVNSTTQALSDISTSAGTDVEFIVGKINWNPVGVEDELFLFDVNDFSGGEPSEGSAFATHTADFVQTDFNIVSLWDRPNSPTVFDELRFGDSYEDVLANNFVSQVPEPASLALLAIGGMLVAPRRRAR